MTTSSALEHAVHFIAEQHSKSYKQYGARVAQVKNVLRAKNNLQDQTCSGLGRCGA